MVLLWIRQILMFPLGLHPHQLPHPIELTPYLDQGYYDAQHGWDAMELIQDRYPKVILTTF